MFIYNYIKTVSGLGIALIIAVNLLLLIFMHFVSLCRGKLRENGESGDFQMIF